MHNSSTTTASNAAHCKQVILSCQATVAQLATNSTACTTTATADKYLNGVPPRNTALLESAKRTASKYCTRNGRRLPRKAVRS